MKIIFLVPFVPPSVNGIGEYTFHLAHNLREAGEDVHIVTSEEQISSEPWVHTIIRNWSQKELSEKLQPMKPDWVSLQYVPQLYHAKGLSWNISGTPTYLKKILKCRITVTFHEFMCAWGLNPKQFFLAVLFRLQTRRLLSGCDFAVTTCEIYKDILSKFPGKVPVYNIPVGANILPQASEDEILALKSRLRIGKGKVFSIFGRLSNFRDPVQAIEIIEKARAQGIEAFLFLIGCMRSSNPEIFNALMRRVEEKNLSSAVFETGDRCSREVSLYLAASDIFLFPQTDGISTRNTTLISAIAHGLPIVSYVPSPGNFEGKPIPYAALAPQRDERDFVEKALHFASQKPDDQGKKQQMNYYQARFSWNFIAAKYSTLMKAL